MCPSVLYSYNNDGSPIITILNFSHVGFFDVLDLSSIEAITFPLIMMEIEQLVEN